MESLSGGLSHLFMTVFLYFFSLFMVSPAITDVTLAALCPGQDECSSAIYLTGFQQSIVGLGGLVTMPLIGNLSDTYGRKIMLTLPITLNFFPLAILAYRRSKNFFYAYYVTKTLAAMICEGSVYTLSFAYLADKIARERRASSFGILSGIGLAAFVCGNLSTRFLSTSSTFQVAALMAFLALVYMRVFLPESIKDVDDSETDRESVSLLDQRYNKKNHFLYKSLSPLYDSISLLKNSPTFSQAAAAAMLVSVGESGLATGLLYYLKACFLFNKDQFADLMVIGGVAGTLSQLLILPIVSPILGEENMLSIGLFFTFANIFVYSIAWSSWVPYAASILCVLSVFALPSLRSIASKQIPPSEQGKAQGCITGISSFSNVISPLVFSPITALFLSERAPFYFPGFSLMCAALFVMIAFIQSIIKLRSAPILHIKIDNYSVAEP